MGRSSTSVLRHVLDGVTAKSMQEKEETPPVEATATETPETTVLDEAPLVQAAEDKVEKSEPLSGPKTPASPPSPVMRESVVESVS
jgi:hypothetical protein